MVPSLQNICGVPAVIVISNHPILKNEIFSTSTSKLKLDKNPRLPNVWRDALQDVASKILKDYNPVLKSIFPILQIEYIGIEMLKWAEHVQTCFDLPLKFSTNFMKSSFFTSKGMIDEEKAARELVSEPNLSIFLKYKIACHYFLEDIIPHLWQEFQNEEPSSKKIKLNPETPMVMWSEHLEERKSASVQKWPSIILLFRVNVLFYGIKNKNVAAVKFSLRSEEKYIKSQTDIDREKRFVHKSFYKCMSWILNYFNEYFDGEVASDRYLFSKDFAAHYNLIEYFISGIKKEELKKFLHKSNLNYIILRLFLHWPFQYQFMNVAKFVYDNLNKLDFCKVIKQIVNFHDRPYNYRLLLREFWIKSPSHLRKGFIDNESSRHGSSTSNYMYVILHMFRLSNFTSDDLRNIYLLLKDAHLTDKKKILQIQGVDICSELCFRGNFEMLDFFLYKCLDLNEETARTFKKDFSYEIFHYIVHFFEKCVNDEFFRWVVGNDEIDELKSEIFFKFLHTSNDIGVLFVKDWKEEDRFSLINDFLKCFKKTDANIEEWKKNFVLNLCTVYSPFKTYKIRYWFDQLLVYFGCSNEESSNIKRDVLLKWLPEIAKASLNSKTNNDLLEQKIYFLCSYEEGRVDEFVEALGVFYLGSIRQNMCLLCLNNNHVSRYGDAAHLHCEHHGAKGFINYDDIKEILSSVFDKIEECKCYRFVFPKN